MGAGRMARQSERLRGLGLLRLVRDALGVSGQVVFGTGELVQSIVLNRDHPLARALVQGLAALLAPSKWPLFWAKFRKL